VLVSQFSRSLTEDQTKPTINRTTIPKEKKGTTNQQKTNDQTVVPTPRNQKKTQTNKQPKTKPKQQTTGQPDRRKKKVTPTNKKPTSKQSYQHQESPKNHHNQQTTEDQTEPTINRTTRPKEKKGTTNQQ
jgi:hypothetical protein